MRRPDVAVAIREAMAERARRTGITAERILEEYARVVFVEMGLVEAWGPDGIWLDELSGLSADTLATLTLIGNLAGQDTDVPYLETSDKRRALECLARLLGLNMVEPAHGTAPSA